jgi:ribonuclease BN (tRNA processing enzyme)
MDTPAADTESKTKIILLGTGTPNAEPDRSGPALAIVVNNTSYIVDCGPGVVRRANAAFLKYGIEALNPPNLKYLFITHLHSDHTLGYADFIFTPWVLERNEPLQVYGPPGTDQMTQHLLAAYQQDIKLRLEGAEPANPVGYQVNVLEITPGFIYTDENVTIRAFPVAHGAWEHAYGFRFETPDRVIVVSGDRAPIPDILQYAQGCDVLIHEVYSMKGFVKRVPAWQKYHSTAHTSSTQVAELAQKLQPELVILTHQLLWGATPQDILDEIKEVYKGKVVYGNDLEIY